MMRTEADIREKIAEAEETSLQWQLEWNKVYRDGDEGYISYCRRIINQIQAEIRILEWVLEERELPQNRSLPFYPPE